MSSVAALLEEAGAYQCRMTVDGEKVKLRAPKPLPDDLMERLRRHKADLIHHILPMQILDAIPMLLRGRPYHHQQACIDAVEQFLDRYWLATHDAGWTDAELFAVYPDVSFATVRYDYAGPVTMSALTGHLISHVEPDKIKFCNGLVHYRQSAMPDAVPLWELAEGSR
jgi:hypothetical protein